mgnify:CR=1 FL=1
MLIRNEESDSSGDDKSKSEFPGFDVGADQKEKQNETCATENQQNLPQRRDVGLGNEEVEEQSQSHRKDHPKDKTNDWIWVSSQQASNENRKK